MATATAPAHGSQTLRVNVSSAGEQAEYPAANGQPTLSGDGRLTAFTDEASLVAGDTNGLNDVFVHDSVTEETARVNVSSAGAEANNTSWESVISADGRFVVFVSAADNLVPGDTNSRADVFVHDRTTGETTRVNLSSSGAEQTNGCAGCHEQPAISADGRFVAFESGATDLVSGDTNDAIDIFVHDRSTGETVRVNVSSAGTQANEFAFDAAISADGRFVAFTSEATNLVADDTNGHSDVFVHDRATGETSRVSVESDGGQARGAHSIWPAISADGRFVAFTSAARNLVARDTNGVSDAFVHDRETGDTSRVSVGSAGHQANDRYFGASRPAISADGRYVVFSSSATNLVRPDANGRTHDIFVRDRTTRRTRRISVSSEREQANNINLTPASSADGRFAGFISFADNLVEHDTNGAYDVFVHGPLAWSPLDATVTPRTKSVGPRRKRVGFRLAVTNLEDQATGDLKLCAKAPANRVEISGTPCRTVSGLGPGERTTQRYRLAIKPAARGSHTRIVFTAGGVGIPTRTTKAVLRAGD